MQGLIELYWFCYNVICVLIIRLTLFATIEKCEKVLYAAQSHRLQIERRLYSERDNFMSFPVYFWKTAKIESNKRNYTRYLQTVQIPFPGKLQVQCDTHIFNLYYNRITFYYTIRT